MKTGRIVNHSRGAVVAGETRVADRPWSRLRGLLFRPPLGEGQGLALVPCKGVHMWGMRYPIDVAFMDSGDRVVALHPDLQPGSRTPLHRGARWALELPAGTLEATGTRIGDRVTLETDASPRPQPTGTR